MHWLSGLEGLTYGAMRFVIGTLFACHGAQKVFGLLGGQRVTGVSLMLLAGVIEFGCGVAVALGLWTSVAAFIASGEMAVGYFKAHAPHGFWPILNKGELAVVYCFVFLFIATHGAGHFGLDGTLRRSKR